MNFQAQYYELYFQKQPSIITERQHALSGTNPVLIDVIIQRRKLKELSNKKCLMRIDNILFRFK